MEVSCKINVINRLLPSAGQSGPKRLIWANITLSETNSGLIDLNLATSRNKTGSKYRVTNNIEQVFGKFVSQGKLTMRFKQPPHDLCLNGEAKQMEKILAILKGGDGQLKKGSLSTALSNTSAKVVIPKTKLNISSRSDYPVTTSFPDTLTCLKINNIALKKVDRRILRLKLLEILDLSNNQISALPDSLQPLSKLKQLNLSKNNIQVLPDLFVKSTRVSNLDVSHNQLNCIPKCISRISSLQTLKLDHNQISSLPRTMYKLKNLRTLTMSSNKVLFLPASFQTLSLDHIDVFGNPFGIQEEKTKLNSSASTRTVASLLALSAKSVITSRLVYAEGEVPSTLINYVDEAPSFCPCGRLCIDDGIISHGSINLLNVSDSVCGDKTVPLEMILCSLVCFHRFANNLIS